MHYLIIGNIMIYYTIIIPNILDKVINYIELTIIKD